MIDDKLFIGLGTTLIVSLVGWAFKNVNERISRNEQQIKALEDKTEREYQSKEIADMQRRHFSEMMTEIRQQLKSINDKLDRKADK